MIRNPAYRIILFLPLIAPVTFIISARENIALSQNQYNILHPRPTIVIQRASIPDSNKELGLGIAEFPPFGRMMRKKATGPEVCYVLDGEVIVQTENTPPVSYHAGDSFRNLADAVHTTSAGSRGAKVVAAWVLTPGKVFNIPVTPEFTP